MKAQANSFSTSPHLDGQESPLGPSSTHEDISSPSEAGKKEDSSIFGGFRWEGESKLLWALLAFLLLVPSCWTSPSYSCSNQDFMGGYHACFMSSTGSLKCWGYNTYGSLGYGDTANRGDNPGEMGDALAIVDVGTGRTVVRGAGQWYSECVILDNTDLKCWGYNAQGQLGYGHTSNLGDGAGEMGDSLLAVDLGTNRYALLVFSSCKS